jgi:hypothetical protein
MCWLVVRNISGGGKMALQTPFRGIPVTNGDEWVMLSLYLQRQANI